MQVISKNLKTIMITMEDAGAVKGVAEQEMAEIIKEVVEDKVVVTGTISISNIIGVLSHNLSRQERMIQGYGY